MDVNLLGKIKNPLGKVENSLGKVRVLPGTYKNSLFPGKNGILLKLPLQAGPSLKMSTGHFLNAGSP
jgi:hypothetical protein